MKGLIFTYALTYGGAAVSLVNPFAGLLIYVCFAILRPESMWHWSVPAGNYSRIIAIALLLGWVTRGFGDWRLGRATGVVAFLLGFFFWSAISASVAPEGAVAWPFVEELAKVVLPFLVGITMINSTRQLRPLAWVIVASHGYMALELNLSYYEGFNRLSEVGFGGMDNNCIAIAMVSCTGMAIFLGMHEQEWWRKVAALIFCMLMIHTVLFAFSRGGMLALILTGFVSFVLIPKRPIHLLVFAVAMAVAFRLAGAEVQQRFFTSFNEEGQRDESADSRVRLWADCWDVMNKNPVTGLGPRHWPLIAATYGWPAGKEAHSLWLQTGAELGFPGLALIVGFYGWCVIRLWPIARARGSVTDPWLSCLACAVIASIIGFAFAAQFVSLVGLEAPYYIALVGAGVLKLASAPSAIPQPTVDENSVGFGSEERNYAGSYSR